MNNIKLLTANILACGIIMSTGFSGNVFAEENSQNLSSSSMSENSRYERNREYRKSKFAEYKHSRRKGGWYHHNLQEVITEDNNRSIAEIGLEALYVTGDLDTVDQYFSQDYIQHNPFGVDGIEMSKSIFIYNQPENYKAELGMMLTDGEFVLQHSRFTGFDAFYKRPIIAVDVYRMKEGKLVEHWDVVQEEVYPEETASGNAMFPIEPSTEYVSERQEKYNARLVKDSITRLINGDESVLEENFVEDYINHSPDAPNGLDSLRGFSAAEFPEGFKYEIGLVVADGPFVALHTRASGFGPTPVITFDIFRVSNNKIVEHWDVIQDEVAAENTASGNPMFPIE